MQNLTLPANFNPSTLMLSKTTEFGLFHETRQATRLAAQLIANGTAHDCALAADILKAVLACQERDERDPHYGNFYWMREDSVVEDLNAVAFNLESLIPMMLQHGERLSPDLRQPVLTAIRLGLDEVARLDVLVAYTNITVLDILNSCLGGELLGDAPIAQRGYTKLARWMAYTNQQGHPLEYNSPTYTAVTLRALKRLADLTQHAETRQRAQAMTARLALSVALHLHRGTGRWAGPHGRAYQPSVVCETPPERELLQSWLADGIVPAWVAELVDTAPAAFQVTETAERDRKVALTTYHTPAWVLGTATSSVNPQANVCMAHYRRPQADRPGVLYTRYITDDKWFGDAYHATDRTKTRNLPDEGDFFSVQAGNRMIGVYGPQNFRHGRSAKAVLIWTQRPQIDEIWVGATKVTALPHVVEPGQVVVIGSGDIYMAVRPLTVTPLGKDTPVQLVERAGDLVLECYNYRGPEKRFWEMGWPGAFYQGKPIVAFYLELSERTAEEDGQAFGARVASGLFTEHADPPFTYAAAGERNYAASYARDGEEIGLLVDRMNWQLKRRWTATGDLGWPPLAAPLAQQTTADQVAVGEAALTSTHGPLWVAALPASPQYLLGYLGLQPATLTLTTPQGTTTIEVPDAITLLWRDGQFHQI
ncbi:MAG: hypothetical protein KF832_14820 [Caldilineaceae bacterium]|nr:hypothetical protein [Caldilineaceae bacterium]